MLYNNDVCYIIMWVANLVSSWLLFIELRLNLDHLAFLQLLVILITLCAREGMKGF